MAFETEMRGESSQMFAYESPTMHHEDKRDVLQVDCGDIFLTSQRRGSEAKFDYYIDVSMLPVERSFVFEFVGTGNLKKIIFIWTIFFVCCYLKVPICYNKVSPIH